jgi:hypothetical protein
MIPYFVMEKIKLNPDFYRKALIVSLIYILLIILNDFIVWILFTDYVWTMVYFVALVILFWSHATS